MTDENLQVNQPPDSQFLLYQTEHYRLDAIAVNFATAAISFAIIS